MERREFLKIAFGVAAGAGAVAPPGEAPPRGAHPQNRGGGGPGRSGCSSRRHHGR